MDVMLVDLVAPPARARVQEEPHAVLLVETHLDEAFARAERAELVAPAPVVAARLEAVLLAREGLEALDASPGRTGDLLVRRARRERNRARDGQAEVARRGAPYAARPAPSPTGE